jgi:hypothetical protein
MPEALHLDCEFADRFVYWRGASGRRYIHTVYDADACPPLPGAVFVAVARGGDGYCRALAVGRFPKPHAFNLARPADDGSSAHRADEMHVHLLAEDEAERRAVVEDLRGALQLAPQPDRAKMDRALAQPTLFAA